jgi:hypothetical protein
VEFDLLDDDDHDDYGDDDDVGGNDDDGDDDDDAGNYEIDEDHAGNYIVGKAKVDDDENEDDTSYHHNDEDSDSDSEPSMPPDSDNEMEYAVVENDQDLDPSGRRRIYETNRRDGDRRGVSTSTGHTAATAVQPIPVVRTPTAAVPTLLDMDELIHVRGMSRSESLKCRQKFMIQRLNTFVKTDLFRKIKFINSDTSLQKAMKMEMNHEDVPPQHHLNFQRIYESAFNEALNTKRSACEQSAGKIVRKTMDEFELDGIQMRSTNDSRQTKLMQY